MDVLNDAIASNDNKTKKKKTKTAHRPHFRDEFEGNAEEGYCRYLALTRVSPSLFRQHSDSVFNFSDSESKSDDRKKGSNFKFKFNTCFLLQTKR